MSYLGQRKTDVLHRTGECSQAGWRQMGLFQRSD